ncbi:MAG: protein-glutamate O-methyltransferase CheR [Oligoflexales bacterium]
MTDVVDEGKMQELIEAIRLQYGYDFTGYAPASLTRRVNSALNKMRTTQFSDVLQEIQSNPSFFREFLCDLTVNVTEMFRDPSVYLMIRQKIVPMLRTYPSIKIWHAGCATGEEVYSMAILLHEEGLYRKTLLYATDISPRAIEAAKEGIYPASQMKMYTANYQKAGGIESFSNYYTAKYGSVRFSSFLKERIVFSQHNLVTDDVFSEVHLVMCRNVLIYFGKPLQNRVIDLLGRSLVRRGYLCLGAKESLDFYPDRRLFEIEGRHERIFRKI